MSIAVQTFWNSAGLQAATKSAFRTAAVATKEIAQANSRSKRVARSITVRFAGDTVAMMGSRHPLAHLFEKGAQPHAIAPRNLGRGRGTGRRSRRRRGATGSGRALRFEGGDGGFARGSVPHPGMKADPAISPAAAAFPAAYNVAARLSLASAGFGAIR